MHLVLKWLGGCFLLAVVLLTWLLFFLPKPTEASQCFGLTSKGALAQAVKLPLSGTNYTTYSYIAAAAGRTYVHQKVANIVVASYAELAVTNSDKVYKYAETGFKHGGEFKPHKTHQNGLSIDFMTPVINLADESVHLPTHVLNRFGYDIEFDERDHFGELTIDYDALAAHIVALDKAAKAHDAKIWRVIFDPELQPNLFATQHGKYLTESITFSTKRSWVRHDEHYHVDFEIPCLPLSAYPK